MNVDDIKDSAIPTDFSERDRLDWIFHRQHELMQQYIPIERHNGLCWTSDCPVNLNDRFGQARLKDFFWRVTEELTEAVAAEVDHPDLVSHKLEELADALHFLVEATILAGITPDDIFFKHVGHENTGNADKLGYMVGLIGQIKGVSSVYYPYSVIHEIGCASNCLKQRPWKTTHQLVDREKFRHHFLSAFWNMIALFVTAGLNADEIYIIYMKKAAVNQFRQRSNY